MEINYFTYTVLIGSGNEEFLLGVIPFEFSSNLTITERMQSCYHEICCKGDCWY